MVVFVRELLLPSGCFGAQGNVAFGVLFMGFDLISHLKVTGLYSWAGIYGFSPSHGKSLVIFALCRSQFGAWSLPRGMKVTQESGESGNSCRLSLLPQGSLPAARRSLWKPPNCTNSEP